MSLIELKKQDYIATILLNRPDKLNALSSQMLRELLDVIRDLDADEAIRVVLIQSNSEKAFSVGADINEWGALQPLDMWQQWVRYGHRTFNDLAGLRQPVIAVLDGYTLGGGLELAMTADIRIASDKTVLGQPEVKIATLPGWGGTQRLPQLVGIARAKQMIFSGATISAKQAEQWGLVNEVVAPEQLNTRTQELADQISHNAPLAIQFAKQIMDAQNATSAPMILEALSGALSATTKDGIEGQLAFKEKREPDFKYE